MPEEEGKTEVKEGPMTTYYVETNNNFFRLNIPKTWEISTEGGVNGWMNFIVKEEGQLKYMIPYVLSVRTTSISAQEAEAVLDDNNVLSGVSWSDVDVSAINNAQTAQRLRSLAMNRNRQQNGRAPSSAFIDEPYYADEVY